METLGNWKLNVSSLYPVGLKHYGNDKTTVVIVWGSNLLCTKRFRSFTSSIENNLPPDKDQVRQIGDCTITQVITGKFESVILTENGRLMYFETSKILRKVDYVSIIKSICASKQGFVILHLNKEGNITIMVHPDKFPCSPTLLRTYDVSFEKNFCQTTWNNAHFNITTLHANPDKPTFFNNLRKCPEETYTANDSFIFFSINNTILSLVVSDDDYHYHQIHTHSSNIRGIHSSKDLNSIYVLLESGVIDVIYLCEILGVIKISSLYFMYDVGAYDLRDDIFVYSDGFQVVMGRIEYCSDTRTYKTNYKTIPLPGITAFTTVQMSKTVLCLSENRKFYKIPYGNKKFDSDKPKCNTMIPLEEFLNKAEKTTIDIQCLVDCYDNSKSELLLQHKMFDALALQYNYKNDKSVFRFPLSAKLKMHRTIPDLPATAIYPTAMSIAKNACFLQIQIQPHRYGKVFSSNIWSLSIQYDTSQTLSKVYRLIGEDFAEPVDILIALEVNKIVPAQVRIDLSTAVEVGQDVLCISFPVKTDILDYKDIMKISKKISNDQKSLNQPLVYCINLPKRISMTELIQSVDSNASLESIDNSCYLNLFNSFLELNVDATSTKYCLRSQDAVIMFHVKKMLIERFATAFNFSVNPVRSRDIQKYIVSENFFLRLQFASV